MSSQPSAVESTVTEAPGAPGGPRTYRLDSDAMETLNALLDRLAPAVADTMLEAATGPLQQRDRARDLAAHWEAQADALTGVLRALLVALDEAHWAPTWAQQTKALEDAASLLERVDRENTGREDVPLGG